MKDSNPSNAVRPVFRKCPRCEYSLRGLPANHVCPECGLRFDQRCALFRVTNPKQVLAIWLLIFAGGWANLTHLPDLMNLSEASPWETVCALTAPLWVVCVVFCVWFFVRRYRRGYEVSIVSDGLIVRLPGFSDELIPWSDIGSVAARVRPTNKPQIASFFLKSKNKAVDVGGVANVFPTRADVERFVLLVTERVERADVRGELSCSREGGAEKQDQAAAGQDHISEEGDKRA